MSREWSHRSRWSLAAVLIVVAVMTMSSLVAGASLGGASVAGAVAATSPVAPASHATPAATNTGTTSTDLGGNTVPVGGSVGVTLPNAIPSNYTRAIPLELSAFEYSPTLIFAGEGVTFITGTTTGGVPPYTSSWTFWNSAGAELGTANGDSASFAFAAAGNYTVFNNIVDGVGNTGSWNETLTVYAPLQITVSGPSTVTTNQNLTIRYAITGGDGFYCLNWTNGYSTSSPYGGNSCPNYPTLPLDYAGVPATGSVITHYPVPGTYQPTFVVTDATFPATYESSFYINVENSSTSAVTPPLGGWETTSIYSPATELYAPYASPIRANITTMPMTQTVDIVTFPTGGSGSYLLTLVWGDGTPNTQFTGPSFLNISWSTIPGYYTLHTYATPAIYQVAIFVNDSLGQSEKFVNVFTVTYVAPTVQLGYLTSNGASDTLSHLLGNTTFSTAPSDTLNIRISVDRATQGIFFWGSLYGGESPFTGSLSNTSVSGIQTVTGFYNPSSCDFNSGTGTCYTNVSGSDPWVRGYVFSTNIPGTYHFTLTMTDHVGNTAGANLIITVFSSGLSVDLTPLQTTIAVNNHVSFNATIWNVSIPAASATGQQNVTFTFYIGFGTAPTYGAYGDSHAAGVVIYTFTGAPGSTQCTNGCPVAPPLDSSFLSPSFAWKPYLVAGTFDANATVNYGLGFNDTTAVPADDYFVSPSTITVTAHPILVFWTTIPYPPDDYTGQSLMVTAHISGGDGVYSMYLKAGNGSRVWINNPTESLCTTINSTDSGKFCPAGYTPSTFADQNTTINAVVNNSFDPSNYYPSNSTFYYNITWFVWYPGDSSGAPGGVFGHYTFARDPGYGAFNLTGIIDIRVSAPLPLSVTLSVSEFSYAGDCYFAQAPDPAGAARLNDCAASGTHWTAYLNISGSVGPYDTSIFWSAGPGSIFAPLVNLTGSGPGITEPYCTGLGGNWTAGTCNYPTGIGYFVGSFAVFLMSVGDGTSASYVFSGVYVSPSSSSPGDYINAEHAIRATVTATGQTIPYFGNPTVTKIADTYGIPYIETSLILSTYNVVIPNSIAAQAPTFFGEYPNLQDYTYFWVLVNETGSLPVVVAYQNTTSDVARFYVPAGGDYTIYVTATSPVSGETAVASADFIAVVAPPLVTVLSSRAQVTLDRVSPTTPPANPYNAFAGDVDWGATGWVNISFAMPGANFTVNSVYDMTVGFSYTLGITVFDCQSGSWETYFYNMYQPNYYSSTLNVLAQGTLSNVSQQLTQIQQQIGDLNNSLQVSTATLASLIANGFATVENGILTIYDQGATILSTLETVNASIATVTSTAIYLNTTLGTIQTTLAGIQATLTSIQNGVVTLTTDVGTLTNTVNGLSATISQIEGNVVTINTKLGSVMATLGSINTTVTTTASGVSSLLGSMVTVTTDLGTLSGQVTGISNGVASIQTSLGTLNANVSAIKTDTGTIQTNTNQVTTYFIIVIVLVLVAIVAAVLAVVRVNSVARRLEESMRGSGGMTGGQQPPKQP